MTPKYKSKHTGKVVAITHILKDKRYRCEVIDPGQTRSKVGDDYTIKEEDLFDHWEIIEATA